MPLLRGEVACHPYRVRRSLSVLAWVQRGMALAAVLVVLLAALAARNRQRQVRSRRPGSDRPRTLPGPEAGASPSNSASDHLPGITGPWVADAAAPPVPEAIQRLPGRVQSAPAGSPLRARAWRASAAASAAGWPAPVILLSLGVLAIYLVTRRIGLERFPIYFFSDEAVQANLAADLLQRRFHDAQGNLFPPYFQNVNRWQLSMSVYVHSLSVGLFGKSVATTRATSVLVGLLGAAALALTLKVAFRERLWWTAPLVLGALPAWFLHTRTAFETALMVPFFAGFLAAYLLYRYVAPGYLLLALVLAAATFYSYGAGPGLVLVSGVLLACSDLRFHCRQTPRLLFSAAGLTILLAIPFARYRVLQPDALERQAAEVGSYWLLPIMWSEKLARFGQVYLAGLDPRYWFLPNELDLERHRFLGQAHLPLLLAPFALIGLIVCLRHWRSPAHRAVLITLLATPVSAALASLMITRVLAMVVPATLLICLGLAAVARRWRDPQVRHLFPLVVGLVLVSLNIDLTRAALQEGPTWSQDYGLYGLQWGAKPVFTTLRDELARDPAGSAVVSPTWANNPGAFLDFFLPPAERDKVQLSSIDRYLTLRRPLDDRQLFVIPPWEYEQARASDKLVVQPPERIIPYPNGQPGFYFVRLRYGADADARFAADRAARPGLRQATAVLDGQTVQARHSLLDMGRIEDLFDHNPRTLIRGFEANPLVLEFEFPSPRSVGGLSLDVATMDFSLATNIVTPSGETRRFTTTYRGLDRDPHVDYALPSGPVEASRLRLEIQHLTATDEVHVHVYELGLH
jgi:hypothetical protein